MYAYLDRALWDLHEPHRFLIAAMRVWVESARAGRCPCAALAPGFAQRGAAPALRDFAIAMGAVDQDGLGRFRFNPRGHTLIHDDEARLLALFDAALAGLPDRVRRIAASLVIEEAVARFATSAEWVALHLNDGTFVEREA